MNLALPAFPPASRLVGRTAAMAALILVCGGVIGASIAGLTRRPSTAAVSSEPMPSFEAARAITDRLQDRLQLTDSQAEAVRKAFDARAESVAAIRTELEGRLAVEHGKLDRELRGILSADQFAGWQKVLEDFRAGRRRRFGGGFGRGD
jgi:hypothetical protein